MNRVFKFAVIFLLTLIVLRNEIRSQSYQFSQFYNTYQLLNPAFTGITGQKFRFGSIVRHQWMGISDKSSVPFRTIGFFGHQMIKHPLKESIFNPKTKESDMLRPYFSLGGGFLENNQSNNLLKIQSIFSSVAYLRQLSKSNEIFISGGFEFNYQTARLTDYIFLNDFLNGNNLINPGERVSYFNMTVGLSLMIKNTWFGASLRDVLPVPSTPSFFKQNLGFYDNVNIHAGQTFVVGEYTNLKFSALWKRFQNLEQFESAVGGAINFKNGSNIVGTIGIRAWIKNPEGFNNMDAITTSLGFNNLKFGSGDEPIRGSIIFSSDPYSFNFGSNATTEISLVLSSPLPMKKSFKCYDFSHGPMASQIALNLYGGREPYESDKDKKDRFDRSDAEKKTKTFWSKSVLNGLKKNHGRSAKKALKRRKRF